MFGLSRSTPRRVAPNDAPAHQSDEGYECHLNHNCLRPDRRNHDGLLHLKWAPRTGPLAKMYNGANHSARGGTVQWSRNDSDTRQPASSGLRWKRLKAARRLASVSTIGLQLKSTSCSYRSRQHPSGCTLFSPFHGPVIGANHTVVSCLILSHNLTKRRDLLRQGLQGNVAVTHRL